MPDGLWRSRFPCLFLSKHRLNQKGSKRKFSRSQNKGKCGFHRGSHFFKPKSLCTLKRQILCLNSDSVLLSKSFNLRSPSVLICKQPFLNDLTGFSGQASHAGSRSSLGLPVYWPLVPCYALHTLPSKLFAFILPRVYFSHSSSLKFHCALSLSPGQAATV